MNYGASSLPSLSFQGTYIVKGDATKFYGFSQQMELANASLRPPDAFTHSTIYVTPERQSLEKTLVAVVRTRDEDVLYETLAHYTRTGEVKDVGSRRAEILGDFQNAPNNGRFDWLLHPIEQRFYLGCQAILEGEPEYLKDKPWQKKLYHMLPNIVGVGKLLREKANNALMVQLKEEMKKDYSKTEGALYVIDALPIPTHVVHLQKALTKIKSPTSWFDFETGRFTDPPTSGIHVTSSDLPRKPDDVPIRPLND